MAWTIGNVQNAANQAAATTATLTKPTGLSTGDIIFAQLCVDIAAGGDPGAVTWPSGFTSIQSDYVVATIHGSIRHSTAWKLATGSEPANYSPTWASSGKFSWCIVGITPPAGTVSIDVSAATPQAASTSNIVAPALTGLSGSADLELCAFAAPGGGNPFTLAGGLTSILNNNQSNTDGVFLALGYIVLASNANTPTYTTTATFPDIADAHSIAFQTTGGGVGISGMAWWTPVENRVRPQRYENIPVAFVSNFNNATVSGNAWRTQVENTLRPKRYEDNSPSYVQVNIAGISGMPWRVQVENTLRLRRYVDDSPSYVQVNVAGISGMSWYRQFDHVKQPQRYESPGFLSYVIPKVVAQTTIEWRVQVDNRVNLPKADQLQMVFSPPLPTVTVMASSSEEYPLYGKRDLRSVDSGFAWAAKFIAPPATSISGMAWDAKSQQTLSKQRIENPDAAFSPPLPAAATMASGSVEQPLRLKRPAWVESGSVWAPIVAPSPVVIAGMSWAKQSEQVVLKARVDFPDLSYVQIQPPPPAPITGMAWWGQVENRLRLPTIQHRLESTYFLRPLSSVTYRALVLTSQGFYPTSPMGLKPGALWSLGVNMFINVVPGVLPDPLFPAIFFGGEIDAQQLLVIGGGNLPTTDPQVATQIWNSNGVLVVSQGVSNPDSDFSADFNDDFGP